MNPIELKKHSSNNEFHCYQVIDQAPNLNMYLANADRSYKNLNVWNIWYRNLHSDFIAEMKDYIIATNEFSLEELIINELNNKNMHISCAESCTGGLMISRLIGVSGASNVIEESYVTYSNEAKMRILDVKKETIEKYSVTSLEVAKEMAEGLKKITNANVVVSVTGFAGGGSVKQDTDGLCYFCIIINNITIHLEEVKVNGNRNECRYAQSTYILWRVLQLLRKI